MEPLVQKLCLHVPYLLALEQEKNELQEQIVLLERNIERHSHTVDTHTNVPYLTTCYNCGYLCGAMWGFYINCPVCRHTVCEKCTNVEDLSIQCEHWYGNGGNEWCEGIPFCNTCVQNGKLQVCNQCNKFVCQWCKNYPCRN